MKYTKSLVAVFTLVMSGIFAVTSQAATIQYDGSGQINGATGVTVAGDLYDVEFVVGDCITVFAGCTESTVWLFDTYSKSIQASQAIFDQIFPVDANGNYINNPGPKTGWIVTPYDVAGGNVDFATAAILYANPASNFVSDIADRNFVTREFAVWSVSAVPVPAAVWLFGSGLIGLMGFARRKKA